MNKKILFIEDDLVIRFTTNKQLQKWGFEITVKEDGYQAYEFLMSTPTLPDLIITDIMMPNMSGIELANFIRGEKRLKNIPIIAITALNEEDLSKDDLPIFDLVITKPTFAHVLKREITQILKLNDLGLQEKY
ncbi:response regulator [Algoriphagus marincola]|uniref:response regulator n=1 Tax=Algoriphagus marincola TaxID=264027 RepID=UPI00068442D6|nr:response regulator [Algoriphagus marincola]